MKNGKTSTGFEFEFDPAALDDMRFVDVLGTVMDDGAPEFDRLRATSKCIDMLIGHEQKAALYEHIGTTHGGRVPYMALVGELQDIMSAPGKDAGKN